jgi:hypothetical protein
MEGPTSLCLPAQPCPPSVALASGVDGGRSSCSPCATTVPAVGGGRLAGGVMAKGLVEGGAPPFVCAAPPPYPSRFDRSLLQLLTPGPRRGEVSKHVVLPVLSPGRAPSSSAFHRGHDSSRVWQRRASRDLVMPRFPPPPHHPHATRIDGRVYFRGLSFVPHRPISSASTTTSFTAEGPPSPPPL